MGWWQESYPPLCPALPATMITWAGTADDEYSFSFQFPGGCQRVWCVDRASGSRKNRCSQPPAAGKTSAPFATRTVGRALFSSAMPETKRAPNRPLRLMIQRRLYRMIRIMLPTPRLLLLPLIT